MKIPALRIEVNGELVAIAGAKGLSLLSGTIGLGSGQSQAIDASEIMFSVMGLNVHCAQPQQLTWCNGLTLKQGDRVTFEVVQVEQTSPPDKSLASPSTEQLAAEATRPSSKRGTRKP
jgi:hypothetical protein